MRYIAQLLIAVALALSLAVSAQAETIPPKEAAYYVGQAVTVEGVVAQVSSSRGTTFINFGGRYPNHVFYAVVFKGDAGRFAGLQGLEGRVVEISGTIELYKGKPQIILKSPGQISVGN
ncbi:nucleotide-binding protein [Pseudooceanicola sp. 502str34]